MKNYFLPVLFLLLSLSGSSQIINSIAGTTAGFSGDGGAAVAAKVDHPRGAVIDRDGNVYITDEANSRLRKITPTGIISTIAGTGSYGFSGDGGAATAAQLDPYSVAVDSSLNIYIADKGNNRIRKINTSGIISTIAGTGASYWGTTSGGDGGPATAARLKNPEGIVVDNYGNLIISDYYHQHIRMITPSGIITSIAGSDTNGGYSGDGGAATSALIGNPSGIAVDRYNNIYFADHGNARIRKISTSGIISTVAGTGSPTYSGDGGAATSATLNHPTGVAVDTNGNIYITDFNNNRIRKINTSGIINTIAGTGSSGLGGDGGPATAARFSFPYSIFVDPPGNVYITDCFNSRVRMICASPVAVTITGSDTVCIGTTITLTSHGGAPTGTWRSSSPSIATVDAYTGLVRGVSAGIDTIKFVISNGCGTVTTNYVITVRPFPSAGTISGSPAVCAGATTAFTASVSGGTWGATNSSAMVSGSGAVMGMASGRDTILYIVSNSCGADTAMGVVTVDTTLSAGTISGPSSVCLGSAITVTSSASSTSGLWVSSNPYIATVNSSGIVTGLSAGVDTISYRVANSCGPVSATLVVTVIPLPYAGVIAGPSSVCAGSAIGFTSTASGGSWGSTSPSIATISSGGLVTGVSPGTDTILYSVTNSCGTAFAITAITIRPMPYAGVISGMDTICVGASVILTDTVTGGVWTSSDPTVATVVTASATAATVIGITAATDTIHYLVTNSCGTAYADMIVTVKPLPDAGIITGIDSVCPSDTIYLVDAIAGGTWLTSNPLIATITGSGMLEGVSSGLVNVLYIVTNFCGSDTAVLPVHVRDMASCEAHVKLLSAVGRVNIHPNPSNGSFAVTLSYVPPDPISIIVTNVLGEKVKELVVTGKETQVQLNAKGIYLVTLIAHGEPNSQPIIIE